MKNKVMSNFIWSFAERFGAQLIQFIVSVVLARILVPEDYGTIALVLVFSQILQVFVDSGLANALIQKKQTDDLDFSSVFYFNVVWCLILYAIVFFLAPYIAFFYSNQSLTWIIRVLCITVVISGVKNVQQAYISRTMQFKKFFFATISGTLISAIVGISIALAGGGVWALVAQKIVSLLVDTLVLWITIKWRPKKVFSFSRLKGLLSFGWKLLASSLIDTVYDNIRQLVIGKLYTKVDLAFYNQGKQFPNFIVTNINASIDSVLLPVMSREQDFVINIKNMTRKAIKISTFVMAPMMMGLVFTATPLVRFVLTDKWLQCVPFLRIFCITYMFQPIHTANLNAIKAMGRSDLVLRLEVIKKIIGLLIMFLSIRFGVLAMAYSLLFSSLLNQMINAWPNKRLLNYGYIEQLKDILPNILLAIAMGVLISWIALLKLNPGVLFLMQVFLGAVLYIFGAIVFKNDSFYYFYNNIKPTIKKYLKK